MSKPSSKTQQVIDRRNKYMTINYGRYPIVMVRGKGCRLWDADGREYLDLFSGFGASILGHCHDDLVRAVTEQAGKLWHVGNLLHTEPQTLLAQAIAEHGFGGRSFFCHSGADANESAFKLARLYGQANPGPAGHRFKIISAINSFHGRSFATMVATGQDKVREGYQPHMPGFMNVPYNDVDAVTSVLDDHTVAVIVEPIQGEAGVIVPDDDYLTKLRQLCDQQDLLLIFDEVWTGCGRTGKYFAYQHWGAVPDIMTLAKGVGGGLAVGVMCANERTAKYFDWQQHGAIAHATTLGGNCLAMAVAATIFDVLERDGLVENARKLSEHVAGRLRKFAQRQPGIRQVRGKGLYLGIELDPQEGRTWFSNATEVVNQCMGQGVLINFTQNNVLRLAPSLTIDQAQLDKGLSVIESVIAG